MLACKQAQLFEIFLLIYYFFRKSQIALVLFPSYHNHVTNSGLPFLLATNKLYSAKSKLAKLKISEYIDIYNLYVYK